MKIAILDDHQGVALDAAPWGDLGDDAEIVAFSDNIAGDDALVARLEPFDVVVACASARRSIARAWSGCRT